MANGIKIKKTSDGFSIKWPSKWKRPNSSLMSPNDELTERSINVTEKSINITYKAIIVSIIAIVVSIVTTVLVLIPRSSNDDPFNLKLSKENIRNASYQIKNEFGNKKKTTIIDIEADPRIQAFQNFQKSVLAIIYLQEPHEKSHFHGVSINDKVTQVKNNLFNRNRYDNGLDTIISRIIAINQIEKTMKPKCSNDLDKELDDRIIDESLLLCYKALIRNWVNKDLIRNNKVDTSLSVIAKSINKSDTKSNVAFNKAIQPLVLFENDTNNFYFREDLYNYFLNLNGRYMSEIELINSNN